MDSRETIERLQDELKAKAGFITELQDQANSFREMVKYRDTKVEELKESLKKTTENAIRLLGSSLCEEHQNRVKTQSFSEFIAEHEGKCVLCAYRKLEELEKYRVEAPEALKTLAKALEERERRLEEKDRQIEELREKGKTIYADAQELARELTEKNRVNEGMKKIVEAARTFVEAEKQRGEAPFQMDCLLADLRMAVEGYADRCAAKRTSLEQYLGVSMQMLMAREDKRDEIPYLDKLDGIYELLTEDEKEFCSKMGEDWGVHHKGRGCLKCYSRPLPEKCYSSDPCK